MKFPISELDRQKHFDKIYNLLDDDECQIFIDTNIIALCYRIYDSARKEFFEWISILISKQRVNTPLWALNEYTNRFVRNQIEDYLSPLKKINTINKDFTEVSGFLKMNIDSASLKGTNYGDLQEFLEDLQIIEKKLKSISVAAKAKDDDYKLKIHAEIQFHFEPTVLNSSIDDILDKINTHGGVRYSHKLPPGFQDGEKDLNAYGDLIIWHEILEHCRKKNVKKAILITNDGKKDWVYAPQKIIENGKSVPNKSQIKIADPRLVYEFKLATQSEEFYIINFDLLTQILIQNIKGNFSELANALQIAHQQEKNLDDEKKSTEVEMQSERLVINDLIEIDKDSVTPVVEPEKTLEKITYSREALADSEFPLHDDSYSSEVILNLKNYNWYVQNPTIHKFLEEDLNSIDISSENQDKLFVIGRNIYQAACGASAAAVDLIKNIKLHFAKFNDYIAVHLYSGILYEIYFDSYNNFRSNLKSNFISEVLLIKDISRLKPSMTFLDEKLEPFKKSLLYFPSKNNKVKIEITLEQEASIEEDWLGIETHYKNLENLKADGQDILTEAPENTLEIFYAQINVKGLIHLISTSYAIPENQIEIVNNDILEETAYITFNKKKLKKLYDPSAF